ncbi:MAG: PrsW family glutamic-type intramembrane protease [Candidatus Krumholzibacteriota bacterium]
MAMAAHVAFGLLPVALYLVALVAMDSYKLVRVQTVLVAVAAGFGALLICNFLNPWVMGLTGTSQTTFSRYLAPITEETFKGAYLVFLFRRHRVGFLVDAAIFGFAVGAGFGILENIFYLSMLEGAGLFTWVLRGCGTALMHGSTTAVFAIILQANSEAGHVFRFRHLLASLGVVMLLHSLYNHFLVSPVLTALGLVLGVPLITFAIYQRSEKALEKWLGVGFDADSEMLAIITAGKVSDTRIGAYLMSLRDRFAPEVVADMICLLRIQVELAIEAKGLLMLRREGYDIEPGPELQVKVEELRYLEKNIGATGRLAVMPLRHRGGRDSWQKNLLKQG